jgi:hypothetical protein
MAVTDRRAERMAAAIIAGESAQDSGLVTTPEEQAEWDGLMASIGSTKEAGFIVQIPNEWPGDKSMLDLFPNYKAEHEAYLANARVERNKAWAEFALEGRLAEGALAVLMQEAYAGNLPEDTTSALLEKYGMGIGKPS